MSEFKGTKDWRLIQEETADNYGIVGIGDCEISGLYFADIAKPFGGNVEEINANLNLIASAPELLEALQLILPLAKGYAAQNNGVISNKQYIEIAETAINKALNI